MFLNKQKLAESLRYCGMDPSDDLIRKYDLFAETMVDFNSRINITRITDPDEMTVKHIEDSLILLREVDIKNNACYLDIGTGGGVPALPILIARPDIKGTLVDSVGKKLRFSDIIIEKLGLNAKTRHIRVEELAKDDQNCKNRFDLITARAVAKLDVLIGYAAPLLAPGGIFAAYKGEINKEEYERAEKKIKRFDLKNTKIIEYKLSNGDSRTLYIVEK